MRASLPGWIPKSAMTGGKDVFDVPLDAAGADIHDVVITMADRAAEVAGTVRGSRGAPDVDAVVLLFPADRVLWSNGGAAPRRLKTVRVSRSGAYTITNVPAGDYLIVAIDDAFAQNWSDPAILQVLASAATRLTIPDAERHAQDLRTATVKIPDR
jgi:hypothetical protein